MAVPRVNRWPRVNNELSAPARRSVIRVRRSLMVQPVEKVRGHHGTVCLSGRF